MKIEIVRKEPEDNRFIDKNIQMYRQSCRRKKQDINKTQYKKLIKGTKDTIHNKYMYVSASEKQDAR